MSKPTVYPMCPYECSPNQPDHMCSTCKLIYAKRQVQDIQEQRRSVGEKRRQVANANQKSPN